MRAFCPFNSRRVKPSDGRPQPARLGLPVPLAPSRRRPAKHSNELGEGLGHAPSIPRRWEEGKGDQLPLDRPAPRGPARLGFRLPPAPRADGLGKRSLVALGGERSGRREASKPPYSR